MDESSMRDRDAAPATWAELKRELLDVASAIAMIALHAPEVRHQVVPALGDNDTVFAQLLSIHLGRAPGSPGVEAGPADG